MKRALLIIAPVLFVNTVRAQILTIDQTDTSAYSKKTVCRADLSLSIEGDKQKTLLLDASNALNFQLQHDKELLILAASYRFTYDDGQDFLNSGYIHLRWRHGYNNKWQPETYTQYQWDESRGMLHRFIAGENARYSFWHKNDWELSLASGIMYETEAWNYTAVDSSLKPAVIKNQVTSLLKSNNYIKLEGKTSPSSVLSFVIFYQTPFNDLLAQYRLATSVRFAVSFARHFDLAVAFSSLYDNKPVVPINKFYYNFSNGIAYKF